MITIRKNGIDFELSNEVNLKEFVTMNTHETISLGTIVGLNGVMIRRDEWTKVILKDHDMVEFITFITGG